MIFEISAACAAVAFLVLVAYLVTLIQTAKRTLESVQGSLTKIQEELEAVGTQSVSLLTASEKLVKEADVKLHAFDPIVSSVKMTGEALNQVTASVKEVSAAVSRSASGFGAKVERRAGHISDAAEIASLGFQLWQKWQSHKQSKSQSKSQVQSMEE